MMTIINLFSLLAAVAIFAANGAINFTYGLPLIAGTLIGGWTGAHFAHSKGTAFIRPLFIIVTSALILKLVIDLV